jgi:hypothetical protein
MITGHSEWTFKSICQSFIRIPASILCYYKPMNSNVERRGRMVRMLDSQPEGHGFESRRRHGVESVSRYGMVSDTLKSTARGSHNKQNSLRHP